MRKVIIFAIISVTFGSVLGFPPPRRTLADEDAVAPAEKTEHPQDSVAAASEKHEDYDEDDSDMFMEPDGAETESQAKEVVTSSPVKQETRVTVTVSNPHVESTHPVEDPNPLEDKSLEQDSQNFFPSFAELFANHRLSYEQRQYRPSRFLGYFQRDRSGFQGTAASAPVKDTQHTLLGSGNFGVIRGGTYYPEEKESEEYSADEGGFNPYYSTRARSNYYRNPKPQPVHAEDFFANFRDFADITAPPKSSFSHLSVVYANRNSTQDRTTEPRNIFETLRMLEEEGDDKELQDLSATTEIPQKKLSQSKRKLLKLKKTEENKARKYRMTVEPLLALS